MIFIVTITTIYIFPLHHEVSHQHCFYILLCNDDGDDGNDGDDGDDNANADDNGNDNGDDNGDNEARVCM